MLTDPTGIKQEEHQSGAKYEIGYPHSTVECQSAVYHILDPSHGNSLKIRKYLENYTMITGKMQDFLFFLFACQLKNLVKSADNENVVSLPEMVTRSDIGIHRLAILNRNYVDPIFLADIQLYRSPADPVLGNR